MVRVGGGRRYAYGPPPTLTTVYFPPGLIIKTESDRDRKTSFPSSQLARCILRSHVKKGIG